MIGQGSARSASTAQKPAEEGSREEVLWGLLLRRILGGVRSRLEKIMEHLDLTPSQARLLACLGTEKELAQKDAARRLACDPSNVTALAAALESRGLINRRTESHDRRIRALTLTPEGQTMWAEMRRQALQPPEWLSALEPEEAEQLQRLLVKVADAIGDPIPWF